MRSPRGRLSTLSLAGILVVSLTAGVSGQDPSASTGPGVAAEESMTVTLVERGPSVIEVIKAVREYTGLGLADSKGLADSAPVALAEGVNLEEAEALKMLLEDAGAVVEVSPLQPATMPMVEDLLATVDVSALPREEIEERYPPGWHQSLEVMMEPKFDVVERLSVPEYSGIGAYIRTCGRGSFRSPPKEQVLHKQTSCYLAVWGEWLAYLSGSKAGDDEQFQRVRETYVYASDQLDEGGARWLESSLRDMLPASEEERLAHDGRGTKGWVKMIRSKPKKKVTPVQVVRSVRDAYAADPSGAILENGSYGVAGVTAPVLPDLPHERWVNIAFAGACVRDLHRATQWISKRHYNNMDVTPNRSGACIDLAATLWGLWPSSACSSVI